jgi:hypothetical protein
MFSGLAMESHYFDESVLGNNPSLSSCNDKNKSSEHKSAGALDCQL